MSAPETEELRPESIPATEKKEQPDPTEYVLGRPDLNPLPRRELMRQQAADRRARREARDAFATPVATKEEVVLAEWENEIFRPLPLEEEPDGEESGEEGPVGVAAEEGV